MRHRFCPSVFAIGFLLCVGSVSGIGHAQAAPEVKPEMVMGQGHPAATTGPLKITYGSQSAEWTLETLAALPQVALTAYNEHAKANQTFTGVPLSTLLTKLGVAEKPHGGKDFRLYLVAEGADGYGVVYSIGEVTPDVHDGTVLVALTLDGKPLGANGPFQLVATGEKRPARWVRNLAAIRVLIAQ